MTATELYILYGFLGFMSLMLVTMLGFMIWLAISVGRLQGQFSGLTEQMREMNGNLNERINGLAEQMREMNSNLTARIERLEQQMADFREQLAGFREQLAEVRGMMRALHDRMDLLMRHHHNDVGQVVIVPAEEVAAD